jgi:hypothetical protein
MNMRAKNIWEILLAKAPNILTPMSDIRLANILCAAIIVNPLASDPAAEKIKIYEKRVPFINPCPRIFSRISIRVCFGLKR